MKRFLTSGLVALNRESIESRFLRKIQKTDSCWIWSARIDPGTGYGMMNVGGRAGAPIQTHRVSWLLYRGDIPDGVRVLHTCDVRDCVNPDHLFLGSAFDNIRDMYQKKRMGLNVKISFEIAQEIRALYEQGKSFKDIGLLFNLSGTHAGRIVKGQNWRPEFHA